MILIIKQLNNMTLIIKHLKTRFMIHKYGFYCIVFLMFLDMCISKRDVWCFA